MSKDEIKKILEEIEKQGFPLEVKTSEVLKTYGWEVTNQVDYLDFEEEKHRTVDIVAEKNILTESLSVFPPKSTDLAFDLRLVIECKKSTKPWVFHASDFNLNKPDMFQKATSSMQFFINSLAYQRQSHERLINLMTKKFLLRNHLGSPIFNKLGNISFVPFTNGKGQSLHKARMQVCNAILDLNDRLDEISYEYSYGTIFIPIIILDGHLYSYEDEELNPEDGLYYYMTYADSSFIIEIVTEGFLETYLATFEEQIQKFGNK